MAMLPTADEPTIYAHLLREALSAIAETIEELPSAELDVHLADGVSSPAQLAAHVAGAIRAYVLGVGCGLDVERDRPEEFATADMPSEELANALRALADDIDSTMNKIDPVIFDELTVPEQSLFGAAPTREVSRRSAIVSAIRHIGEHLGHLHLSRDMLADRR